jgi:hypothetical protein
MMRLTWRDAVATLFAALVVTIAFAVSGSWGWPLLGSYRAGTVALLALAVPMCVVGGYAFWDSVAFRHPLLALRDPFLALGIALGPVAIALAIGGLIAGTEAWFLGLAAMIVVKWFIATTRHAVEVNPRMGPHGLAPIH